MNVVAFLRSSPRAAATGVVGALLLVFLLPFRIPYTVTVPGRILCARELVVVVNADGGIASYMVDRISGVTKQYSVAQFSRGDAVQFSLHSAVTRGVTITRGATLGIVQSSEVEREIARLNGELANARASFASTVSGEKQSIVEEARQGVEQARRQSEELKAVLARQKMLYEGGMISQQEYELAERRAAVSSINVAIADARLKSATTGAKQEQADFVRTQISSLQHEIDVLERRQQGYTISSPLDGVVMEVPATDTLLIVSDTSEYVVVMPVPISERSLVASDQSVRLYAREVENLPQGRVLSLDKTIHPLGGQQVVLAVARLGHTTNELLHGLIAQCSIECASISPWEYFRRILRIQLR